MLHNNTTAMSTYQKSVFWLYQVLRNIRYGILLSAFGTVSHCQQQPRCGTFFMQQFQQRGLLQALWVSIPRVLMCGISTL